MKFLIEASLLGYNRHRLQKNNTWKAVEFNPKEEPSENDVVLADMSEAGFLIGKLPDTITIAGKQYKVNPNSGTQGDPTVHVQPVVYRITKPRQFTEAEVCSAIAAGDDEVSNVLTIDLEGRVRLREYSPALVTSDFADIAVRMETFCAGNDYVGPEAARDKSEVHDNYLTLLDGWIRHLSTGETNIYQDLSPSESEETMLVDLKGLTEHLK